MTRWLVFGLSGAVGAALQARWSPEAAVLDAVSRLPRPAAPGLCWRHGRLEDPVEVDAAYDAVVSLGPLDRFAAWFARRAPDAGVVVALGSTGVHDKAGSPDPRERALAGALRRAEEALADACARRGTRLVLLRPSLLWGGPGGSLERLAARARRWHWLPVPRGATGLRQPVHVDDVAMAVLAAVAGPAAGAFDLPGGETLSWEAMLRRVIAAGAPSARLVRLPGAAFRAGLALRPGPRADTARGTLARLGRDQVHDPRPAAAALGWAPRPFRP